MFLVLFSCRDKPDQETEPDHISTGGLFPTWNFPQKQNSDLRAVVAHWRNQNIMPLNEDQSQTLINNSLLVRVEDRTLKDLQKEFFLCRNFK